MHSLQNLQKIINEGIADLDFNKQPTKLYKPINYILDMGGKRLRPALCLLACDMFGGNIHDALNPAIGVEVFHNFTLLHDDIMDQAPIRRGKPTVHEKWDPNVAILSGDTMMAVSYDFIMKAPDHIRSKVFSVFNQTAIEVCEGQQYDMDFESQKDVSIADYIKMIRLKTAVLLAGSLRIGAIIADASDNNAEYIYRFGENMGIAFQLKDDLLDVFSDTNRFGKQAGGDIIANKKTFLYLKAFELADDKEFETLYYFFNNDFDNESEKIKGVKEIYERLNIEHETSIEIEKYFNEAMEYLNKIDIPDEHKSELINFADRLKAREY